MAVRLLARLLRHLRDDLSAQLGGWWQGGRARLARAWARRPPAPRLAAQAVLVALVLLGLVALDARARLARRLPSPLDWRALTALLERDARPGDVVAIFPPWLERAREAVPARLPLLATSALDAEWLPGARRVWLVAAAGVTTFGPRLPLSSRAAATDTQDLGQLRVTRLDLDAPVLPLGSLAELAGAPTRWRDVDGVARRCLELAGPPAASARLELPLLSLGGALAGHAALLTPHLAGPVRLLFTVAEGPEIPVEVTARGGWQPFRIDTTRLEGQLLPVTVALVAPADALVCLEALVLP